MSYQIRMPKYLSPSSIKIFEKDVEDYAVKYLLNKRPPRPPQTKPMSVGSAFDGYAKSYIHYALFGNYGKDDQYELETILRDQVEPQNLEWAREAGKDCFEKYKKWGALADLMTELQKALGPPRFEFAVEGVVTLDDYEAPLLGKPDVYFVSEEGIRVVYDFKVNGYCSTRNTSPMKGYVCCRNGQTRIQHKNAVISPWHGIPSNCMMHLEDGNKEWADQLSIYSWLLGEPVGSEKVLFGIDQLTGPGCSRISSHRLRIKPEWQFALIERAAQIWSIIQSGHIFREMTREQSDNRLQVLEDTYGSHNEVDDILS